MIVLLSCFINLYANDYQHSSTGEVAQTDSVLVSYEDLRVVNCKLIELKYEKEINSILRTVIRNDSIIIDTLIVNNDKLNSEIKTLHKENNKSKLQRNVALGVGIAGIIFAILALIK